MLALINGVDVVVLKTVTVLVTEFVTGVCNCKQEHTKAMSEAGRDKILEKMLAADAALVCLLCKAAGVLDTVVVLHSGVSVLTLVGVWVGNLHRCCICFCCLYREETGLGDCFFNGLYSCLGRQSDVAVNGGDESCISDSIGNRGIEQSGVGGRRIC